VKNPVSTVAQQLLFQIQLVPLLHGVSIDAVYASLVVSMCVLVGFASSLDENLNLFEVGRCTLTPPDP
jgi:hypothetical protein